jgi:alginate O-acetyltransferase complex protein AlgI
MLFNSIVFIELLFITFALYYIPKLSKLQVPVLILSSLVFYAYDNPKLVLLLLFSAALNIFSSYYVVYGNPSRRKTIALTGVILNLCGIAFFKYSPLISKTFFNPGDSIGSFLLTIPLPIGISFFTFEGISLLMDVWHEKYLDKMIPRSLIEHTQRTMFFISFFPHLIAGPILKAHDFFPQIKTKKFGDINWERCFKTLIIGYFLKMVVADNLKDFTFWMTYPYFQNQSGINLIVMLFGYSCQIFADFAGYSLIAIGLAKLFGYDFQDNFNFPYIASSFKEFWKRWHISLSSFLMEYLYFPLGGNKKGKVRTYINLMITMILGGLWHGAAWSYAVWGGFHGFALASERFITDKIKIKHTRIVYIVKRLFVFFFVTLAWLLFKLPQFNQVISYFSCIVHKLHMNPTPDLIAGLLVFSMPVILYHAAYLYKNTAVLKFIKKIEFIPYAVLLFLIIVNSGSAGSFIYFQF